MALEKFKNRIQELNKKEDAALLVKYDELSKLSKDAEWRKANADKKAELGEELGKATIVGLVVSVVISKVFKLNNPIIKAMLVPSITTAIMKTNIFKKKKKPLLIDKL